MISKNTNLIIGKPETGKTRGIMFPEVKKLIKEGKNLFIIDNKEEYYPRFKKELEEKGYEVFFINLRNPKQSNGFNVLSYPYYLYSQRKNTDLALELILSFTNIISASNNSADPFWENTASDYFASLITILFASGNEDEINLHSIAKIMGTLDDEEGFTNLMNYLKTLDVASPTYRLASTTAFAPKDTRDSILSVLKTVTNPFICQSELLDTLSVRDFQIEKIKNKKVAIFFEGRKFSYKIANVIIEQLLAEIERQKIGFAFILDNVNSLSPIKEISELIEYANFNNIKTYFVTNSFEELKSKYAEFTFDKIANIVQMDEVEDLKIDESNNYIDYPVLKARNIKIIDQIFLNNNN